MDFKTVAIWVGLVFAAWLAGKLFDRFVSPVWSRAVALRAKAKRASSEMFDADVKAAASNASLAVALLGKRLAVAILLLLAGILLILGGMYGSRTDWWSDLLSQVTALVGLVFGMFGIRRVGVLYEFSIAVAAELGHETA